MIDTQAVRNRILQLAVEGKLVPCDTSKWKDVCLKELTSSLTLNDGDWVLSSDMVSDGEVKLIQLGSIGNCEYLDKGFKYITKQHFKELNGTQIYPGYLLINRLIADRMFVCILPNISGVLATAVDVCWVAPQENKYDITYLMYALNSKDFQERVKKLGKGTTRLRISKGNLINIKFLLPPLAEQKRIVAKVEEIFARLDKIDTAQKQYAQDQKSLKAKLLQLAIEGKLVPCDTSKWKQVKLGDVCEIVNGFTPLRTNVEYWDNGTISWFTVDDIREQGRIIKKTRQRITEKAIGKNSKRILPANTVLLCCTASVGEYAITEIPLTTNQQFNGLIIKDKYIDKLHPFFLFYLVSTFKKVLCDMAGRTTFNFVSVKKIEKIYIPLPPLAEQKRIVAKLEELLPLCEEIG